MYKKFSGNCVLRLTDKSIIPFAQDNKDYKLYSEWLAEGNTPEPEDEPVITIPSEISKRQAKQQLLEDGLLDAVENAISTADNNRLLKIFWEDSAVFERNHPVLNDLAEHALSLSQAQIDVLFLKASKK